jgi:hypothetical protein
VRINDATPLDYYITWGILKNTRYAGTWTGARLTRPPATASFFQKFDSSATRNTQPDLSGRKESS